MTAWIAYVAGVVAVSAGVAATVSVLLGGSRGDGAWLAALVAAAVQIAAFAALVAARTKGGDFVVSWASGMLLRFAAIGAVAFWVTRRTSLDPAVTLLTLIGIIFVLVLLEPAFLKLADGPGGVRAEGPERTSED